MVYFGDEVVNTSTSGDEVEVFLRTFSLLLTVLFKRIILLFVLGVFLWGGGVVD